MSEAAGDMGRVCERIVHEVGGEETAKVLFRGKIVGVERRLFKGHSYGEVVVGALGEDEDEDIARHPSQDAEPRSATPEDVRTRRVPPMHAVATGGTLRIPFKNENIYAEHVSSDDSAPRIIASVPDLISVLDTASGRALGVPGFRYGLRVTVLGICAAPQWTDTARGLDIGGPGAFGFDQVEYKPIGVYKRPRSVLEEFLVE